MTTPHRPTQDTLRQLQPQHSTFVGIDSDGCVFPTMEIKQKQCFHGLIATHWQLEAIEPQVREVAEFVNLYSRHRGQNRFPCLALTFDLLREHPAARAAGVPLPDTAALRAFIDSGVPLGNPALEAHAARNADSDLATVLAWSKAVNEAIARTVRHVPPFRWARASLERIHAESDAICVSQTPTEALVREWEENDLTALVRLIAGQELGTKAEHLTLATHGRYPHNRVLLIGDAPGDLRAARAARAHFYPVNPGAEEASWERFCREDYDRFLAGTFGGEYEQELVHAFEQRLPDTPPWLRPGPALGA